MTYPGGAVVKDTSEWHPVSFVTLGRLQRKFASEGGNVMSVAICTTTRYMLEPECRSLWHFACTAAPFPLLTNLGRPWLALTSVESPDFSLHS